ncbi:hypothetical protein BDW42DRAFT_179691 [Aspergillus taichungensis]|uniref:Uncharacterized protein n=1 Tax=Aspergillus taichungensis TaxID=482145 RepID=A0A2J5HGA8_9EURO|nr:hypothetical protein BDW42DRAFT_179691 [Aspergillus taichungensis]
MILSLVFPISAKVISVGSESTVGSDQWIRKRLHWTSPGLFTLSAPWLDGDLTVGSGLRKEEKAKMHYR